jgi:hypothetical protein
VIDFEGKKVLDHPSQANTTKGKSVVMSDEPRVKMLKPRNPKPGKWRDNRQPEPHHRVKPTSDMLLEKFTRQRWPNSIPEAGGIVQRRSPDFDVSHGRQHPVVLVQHVEVGTLQILVHRLGTEARKKLPRGRAHQSGND